MAHQDALLDMARDKDLTLEPLHVLLYLFARLDFDSYIQVPQVEIVEALDMHKVQVSRAALLRCHGFSFTVAE